MYEIYEQFKQLHSQSHARVPGSFNKIQREFMLPLVHASSSKQQQQQQAATTATITCMKYAPSQMLAMRITFTLNVFWRNDRSRNDHSGNERKKEKKTTRNTYFVLAAAHNNDVRGCLFIYTPVPGDRIRMFILILGWFNVIDVVKTSTAWITTILAITWKSPRNFWSS